MSRLARPLAWSAAGHAAVLVAIAWLAGHLRPPPLFPAPPRRAIAVVFEPPPQPPAAVAAPEPPPPSPPPVRPPPAPRVAIPLPLPPPPKPAPPRAIRRPVVPRPRPAVVRPQPPLPQPQIAALPPPAPVRPPPPAAPLVSASYRGALGAWLQAHKHYPESARQRDEQGEAVLRFTVDRSGRVLNYAVIRSSGYPDLDAAVAAMMRGAVLPPFPSDMTEPQIQVSLAIRFGLTR